MIERIAGSRLALAGLFLLAALAGAAVLFAVQRAVPGAGGDRAAMEQVVHDYMLDHPEIIPQ
ncbi:MAG: hypothetical protein ACTHMG_16125, partial [Sphingomonas sp.]